MNSRDIGQKVKRLRKLRGMTVKYLADQVGLSQGQVSRLETGKRAFRSSTLLRIAAALNVKPICFFMDDPGENEGGERPIYGLATSEHLVEALRSPEYVWVAEELAEAFLHKRDTFVAMKRVAEAILG